MIEYGHFIGGKAVPGKSGRTADVFQPMDGTVRAHVALASKAEVRAAVENALAAQPAWAAVNPQRRARVLMKFLELIARDNDKLADVLAREHGKTIPDARGDIQRGVEVVEFALGVPHLMKGEYTDGAGPGIDIYSMRQPLGVVAGITPFNFPAMIPLWKLAPAIACGNAFILKPSERDPGVPMMLGELFVEAGGPPGILNVVNGDKEAVDAILDDPRHPGGRLRRLDADRALHLFARNGVGEARAVLRRREEPHGRDARRRHGPDGRCADRRGLRLGGRALHGDLGRGAGRPEDGRRTRQAADPARRGAEGRPLDRPDRRLRPARDQRRARARSRAMSTSAFRKARSSSSTGAASRCRATRTASIMGGCLFDNVTKDMRIYKEEIFGPVLSVVRAHDYSEALGLCNDHEYGNGVAIFTRDGDAARDFASKVKVGMIGVNVPIPVPLAYFTFGGWKRSGFGDLNQHGPDSVRFYTRTKTVTARWPSGIKEGANFSIPTMS